MNASYVCVVDTRLRDLNRAMEIAPGDREIRALRSTLKAEVIRQKKSDRATFAGMFSRGSICDTRYVGPVGAYRRVGKRNVLRKDPAARVYSRVLRRP